MMGAWRFTESFDKYSETCALQLYLADVFINEFSFSAGNVSLLPRPFEVDLTPLHFREYINIISSWLDRTRAIHDINENISAEAFGNEMRFDALGSNRLRLRIKTSTDTLSVFYNKDTKIVTLDPVPAATTSFASFRFIFSAQLFFMAHIDSLAL